MAYPTHTIVSTYIHDANAYVEQQAAYRCDKVILTLDQVDVSAEETHYDVAVYPSDVYGVAIVDANPIVNKSITDLGSAEAYYCEMAHQLSQGDVIRNV